MDDNPIDPAKIAATYFQKIQENQITEQEFFDLIDNFGEDEAIAIKEEYRKLKNK